MRAPNAPVIVVLLILLCSAITLIAGDVPQLINVQGLLTDSSDEPVADGWYNVSFAIYNVSSEGTALWSETRPVNTEDGLFTTILGGTTLFNESLFDNSELWLGITMEGDTEMTPHQRLTSVPYALNVPTAAGASAGWIDDGANVYIEDENDNVGIGIDSPLAKLHAHGNLHVKDSIWTRNLALGQLGQFGRLQMYSSNSGEKLFDLFECLYGPCLTMSDLSGDLIHAFTGWSGGGGYYVVYGEDGSEAIFLNSNENGSGEPSLSLFGTSDTVSINLDETGDDAVQLPG